MPTTTDRFGCLSLIRPFIVRGTEDCRPVTEMFLTHIWLLERKLFLEGSRCVRWL